MRIDKFLKVSRILKRRALAVQAADGGKVKVNGKTVKPSYQVKENDIVAVGFNAGTLTFRVLRITETARKEEAESMYEIITE